MIAIGYARRSAKSETQTISLETQTEHIRAYCARVGLDLKTCVTHDGVSGRKRKRFSEIETAVQEHKPRAVVFYHQDRLARDSAGLADYLGSLVKRGIEIHEAGGAGRVDYTGAIGRMSTNIRAVTDQFYAEMIGEKTRDALSSLKAIGRRYSNKPPLGWKNKQVGFDSKRNKPIFDLIEDEEEQRGIETLKRCLDAGLGARRALIVLQAGKYSGRQSLKVIHSTLKRLTREQAKGGM